MSGQYFRIRFRIHNALTTSVDSASLAGLRILLGGALTIGLIRFLVSGWVEELLVRPSFFFKYPGMEWLPVWEPNMLYTHVTILILAAFCVCIGLFYRFACFVFLVGFVALQAMDQSNYLNHYYLVAVLFLLLLFLPAHRSFSVDAWRKKQWEPPWIPAWTIYLFRFQVAIVYIFAAVAKMGSDWLLYGQPMSIWLSSRTHLPLVGPYMDEPWLALTMSWAGFLYDLTIVGFLIWKRTRAWAYCAVLVFHACTWMLFDIGMFPLIMVVSTTIFFQPDWLRRVIRRPVSGEVEADSPQFNMKRSVKWVLAAWCLFHVAFPLRHFCYEGDVLWNERGMRYAWKVMVREKMGSISYRIQPLDGGKERLVNPADYLEPRQLSEMSGQPDLIVQLAHYIRQDCFAKGFGDVAVRVDALVSLTGRPHRRIIDPQVDLTRLSVGPDKYILSGPSRPPLDPRKKGR